MTSPDVVVIGGGIVGTSAAAFLSGAGIRVMLVERDGLASGASGSNSGVVQHPFDPVLAGLYHETLSLYRDLAAVSNAFSFADRPVGLLYVSTEEAAARDQARVIGAAFPTLRLEVLGEEALRAVEPATGPDLWACRVDIGYPVMPGASTYAYATLAESRGAVVRMGRAASLETEGDTVVGVRIDGEVVAAGAVLVAAGPWTPALLDPSGRWSPVRARWGVVVEAELAAPPTHVLEEAGIEAVLDAVMGAGAGAGVGTRVPRSSRVPATPSRQRTAAAWTSASSRSRAPPRSGPLSSRPSRIPPPGWRRSWNGRRGTSRASPTPRSAACARARGRRATTGGRSWGWSRAAQPVRLRGSWTVGDLHRAGVVAAGR